MSNQISFGMEAVKPNRSKLSKLYKERNALLDLKFRSSIIQNDEMMKVANYWAEIRYQIQVDIEKNEDEIKMYGGKLND